MRIVLVLVVLVLVFLLWRAFVFDRRHRGQLRNRADMSANAKRNREQQNTGRDPGYNGGAGPPL